MRNVFLVVVAAAAAAACAWHPPTDAPLSSTSVLAPTPPALSPTTVAGRLTATNGGQPLSGVTATIRSSDAVATTDSDGAFQVAAYPGSARLAFSGATIVPREISVDVHGPRDVAVSAISQGGGFDFAFYRQLVRNAYDAPGLPPERLRRWTRAPNVYIRTVDDAGAPIDPRMLDLTERTIVETVPVWTAGTIAVASTARGVDTRAGQAGWITVTWPAAPDPDACGRAAVGQEGGTIALYYKTPRCGCAGLDVRPLSIRHEVGHAMGFWHTDSANDLMAGFGTAGCDRQPSARERYHAAIAYSRPVGNVDPDQDPSSAVLLAPSAMVR